MRGLIVVLALAGCSTASLQTPLAATTSVPPDRVFYAEPDGATATVVVKRDQNNHLGWHNRNVFLDGKLAASVSPVENVVLRVQPGEHIVGLAEPGDQRPSKSSAVTAAPGGRYYFRVGDDALDPLLLTRAFTPDE